MCDITGAIRHFQVSFRGNLLKPMKNYVLTMVRVNRPWNQLPLQTVESPVIVELVDAGNIYRI